MGLSLNLSIKNFLDNPDKNREKDLIKALKNSELLTAVFFAAPLVNPKIETPYENESFSFISLDDGKDKYIPAFSDDNELSLWHDLGEHEVLRLSLKELSLAINDSTAGIVINPFTSSLLLNKETLDKILNL